MSFKHSVAIFSSIVALGSTACAGRAAVALTPATTVTCPGGTIHDASDATHYGSCNIVQGDLTVQASELTDLQALSNLRQVTGTLRISGSAQLDELNSLENLSSVGALEIHNDAELDSLSGLEALRSAGRIEVTDNRELTTLKGLTGLRSVGRLVLRNNGLFTAAGLSELHEVGELVVANNHQLNSLSSLASLEHASSIEIRNNPVLCGTRLLPQLKRVDGPLVLSGNRAIGTREARLVQERAGHVAATAFAAGEGRTQDASIR